MKIKDFLNILGQKIRENITPRGDGNSELLVNNASGDITIRENITPRGDGNNSSKSV